MFKPGMRVRNTPPILRLRFANTFSAIKRLMDKENWTFPEKVLCRALSQLSLLKFAHRFANLIGLSNLANRFGKSVWYNI